jgi:hypothetical protein
MLVEEPNNTLSSNKMMVEGQNNNSSSNKMMVEGQNNVLVLNEKKKDDKIEKFVEFVEDNLPSLVTCTMTNSTFFDVALCSDGFTYERSVIEPYIKSKNTSPMTRMKVTNEFQSPIIVGELIKFSEKYGLDATKYKFISNDTFEENAEIIQNGIVNGNYKIVNKFNKFNLNHSLGNNIFCYDILTCKVINKKDYIICIMYILKYSENLIFIHETYNILHYFFRYCPYTELIDFLFEIIPKVEMTKMLTMINRHGYNPIQSALENNKEILPSIINKDINLDISIKFINGCISSNVN